MQQLLLFLKCDLAACFDFAFLPSKPASEGCQLAEGEIAGAIADEVTGIWRWKWVPEGTDTGSLKLHLVTSTLSLLSIDLVSDA